MTLDLPNAHHDAAFRERIRFNIQLSAPHESLPSREFLSRNKQHHLHNPVHSPVDCDRARKRKTAQRKGKQESFEKSQRKLFQFPRFRSDEAPRWGSAVLCKRREPLLNTFNRERGHAGEVRAASPCCCSISDTGRVEGKEYEVVGIGFTADASPRSFS